MEQHSEATWNAMTYAARLKLLPLTEAQAKASLAALDKSHKKKAKARAATASEARKPWKERTFVERLHLVIDDDETLAKHVVVEPDHSGAERNAMFQLGLKAWKKKQKNKQNKAEAVDKEADREKEKKKTSESVGTNESKDMSVDAGDADTSPAGATAKCGRNHHPKRSATPWHASVSHGTIFIHAAENRSVAESSASARAGQILP